MRVSVFVQRLRIEATPRERIDLVEPSVVLVVVAGAQVILLQARVELLSRVEQGSQSRTED